LTQNQSTITSRFNTTHHICYRGTRS